MNRQFLKICIYKICNQLVIKIHCFYNLPYDEISKLFLLLRHFSDFLIFWKIFQVNKAQITWIKGIPGHINLAYFQSNVQPDIDPTCRLCLQANETLHHLMTEYEAITTSQLDIMKNKIPLPDMTWSVKYINTFLQHPLIHSLMFFRDVFPWPSRLSVPWTSPQGRPESYTH